MRLRLLQQKFAEFVGTVVLRHVQRHTLHDVQGRRCASR